MSNDSDPTDGAEHPSPYAPKWGRDAGDPQQRSQPHTIRLATGSQTMGRGRRKRISSGSRTTAHGRAPAILP
jgi:hypothetical protein